MPARSISRCETISASFGFSFRMGRKNRDNRMGIRSRGFGGTGNAVKPDCPAKHKAGTGQNEAKAAGCRRLVLSGHLMMIGATISTLSLSEIAMASASIQFPAVGTETEACH